MAVRVLLRWRRSALRARSARSGGLKKLVGASVDEIDAREVNSIPLFTDAEGRYCGGPGRPIRAVPGATDTRPAMVPMARLARRSARTCRRICRRTS